FLNSARGYIGWQVPGSSVWTTLSQPMKGVLYTTPTGSTIAVLRVTYKEDGDIMFHNYLKPRSDGDTRKALYTTTDGTLQLGDVETDYWDVMWSIPTYDSTADLGTYINAAFNNSKGIKNIRFPGKTFSGTAITVPKDIRITGDGNTVIKSMNSSGPAISVAGDNVSIKNIRINGNNIGNVGLLVSKSSNVLADNVEVYNVTGSSAKAIFVDSSFHVTFNRLDIHNIGSGPDSISRGLYASNGGFIIVANSKLDGKGMPWADGDLVHFHTDSTAAGFYSDFHGIIEKNDFINTPKRAVKVQASTVIVKDNYIVSTATDPYFCPLVGIEGFGDRITIKNNYINFLRGTIGIDMTNAVQGILDGNTINVDSAKNYPFGRAGTGTLTGMFFTNTKKMIVINNMIFAHNAGIRFVSDTGSAARANRIYNADTALSTLNSRKVTIDNNDLMSDVGMIALHITTSTTTDSLRVIGNHYKGATVTIPPATIANSRIWGNDWNPDPADLTSAQTLDAKTFTNVAKIGIGTTGTELLEVQGNTTGNVISKVTNTNTTGGARAIQKLIANTVILSNQAIVGDAGYNGTESSHPYILTTAGQNRVYISSAGGVAIGSSAPAASAQLDIPSTSKGILIPRMTDTQMNAISSPASGLQVINTTYNNRPFWYNGTSWVYSPRVSSGTAAPATTPTLVGDTYIDTTNKKMYVATGNSSSADWTITN
ncbi:MAG: hypothetical protein JWQ09_4173, partial [Segetibacter sp.]|nr:hypothetical protein [Segetibacter sp.]